MNNAMVLGATGTMGQALVHELLSQGIETTAFSRSADKLAALAARYPGNPKLRIAQGDAFRADDLIRAGQGADVIFHSVNIPYPEWKDRLLPLGEAVAEAASRLGARLVAIDNIYPYGRRTTERVTEEHPKQPHTAKGRLRLELERLFLRAHAAGTPVLIARFPDFYGPDAGNTILNHTLSSIAAGKSAGFVGSLRPAREYIYMPDAAAAAVRLAVREDAYGETWNVPAAGVITGHEAVRLAREAAGHRKPVYPIGRGLMRVAGWFDPFMREVVEMMYLTEEPVVLSGAKYESRIGALPATPYAEAIPATIRSLRKNLGQHV